MSQGQLRHTLQQAGFKDVTIVDANYVVQAQSPSGDQVMLFINPPEVSSAANAADGDTGGQSTTSHGGGRAPAPRSEPRRARSGPARVRPGPPRPLFDLAKRRSGSSGKSSEVSEADAFALTFS